MFTATKNFIKKYSLVFLGFILIVLFIWFRYIRTRLPKDIPFSYLSAKGFIIITIICIIYILVLKGLLKPTSKKTIFTEYIVPMLYAPFESFDKFIKEPLNKEKIILYMANKLSYIIKDTPIFYVTFAIMPRIILVTVLTLDIFYFHKLHYIYYFIYLTIFLFLNKYIIYCFKIEQKRLIDEVKVWLMNESISTPYVQGIHPNDNPENEDYEEVDPFMASIICMSLPLDLFIEFYVKSIIYDNITRDYSLNLAESYYSKLEKELNIDSNTTNEKEYWSRIKQHETMVIRPKINAIIKLRCLIEYYNLTHNQNKIFKIIKIILFSTYLICWTWILIKSVPNLDITSFIALLLHFVRGEIDLFLLSINHIPFTDELISLYFKLRYEENQVNTAIALVNKMPDQ